MISPSLCVRCKGRLWCGERCRILEKHFSHTRLVSSLQGNQFSGSSPPSAFVSWQQYPKIQLAPLAPTGFVKNAEFLDDPEQWFGLSAENIISFRESLLRSNKWFHADSASNPSYELMDLQELALSQNQVEMDISLEKKPFPRISFFQSVAPIGPSAPMKSFSLASNPRIPKKAENIVSDSDLKAEPALIELYEHDFSVHYLQRVLSLGLLGTRKRRRLVPTRWAITAADDIASKHLVEKIKSFKEIDSIQIHSSSYLDNSFFVLLVPAKWSFEQLEAWLPGSSWAAGASSITITQDHEFFKGRKDYADSVAGAYYAARLAVAEYLSKEKLQAAAIVFREIGQDYNVPLGVWVIRETVRNAFKKKSLKFSSLELALSYLEKSLRVPLKEYKKASKLLDLLEHQKNLNSWA